MQCDSGAAVYEFFAGGGLARLGLGQAWTVTFANDIDPAKAAAYRSAFGDNPMHEGDVWDLHPTALPGQAALAWASFPCQDLSLAGARGGLNAARSSAFFGFWRLIEALDTEGRAPDVLAIENVTGLFTSNGGADLAALCEAIAARGYHIGALEIDAALFAPQSRPRAFVIASRRAPGKALTQPTPSEPFHSKALCTAVDTFSSSLKQRWVWWRLPAPPLRNTDLASVIDVHAGPWRSASDTAALIALMHPRHQTRIAALKAEGGLHIGALFRRMRTENGVKVQRAEPRFDGLAGCLRTPAGGSSRQSVIVIENGDVRTRLLSPREAARLMGAPDDYPLPARANVALKLFGDGVAVPVVRHLSHHLLEPLAGIAKAQAA